MSANSRSISQRLRKASTPALRAEIARDWAYNWWQDQDNIARRIDLAAQSSDRGALIALSAQLRAITDKRFAALPRVLESLAEPLERS